MVVSLAFLPACSTPTPTPDAGTASSAKPRRAQKPRRPEGVVEPARIDWPYGLYHWPDPWVPLLLYNSTGLVFFNAQGQVYRTYAWRQMASEQRSALWVLDVLADERPDLIAMGQPTLFLKSNADVAHVQPDNCTPEVGTERLTGKRRLRCEDAGAQTPAQPFDTYVVPRQAAHAIDESFSFDFNHDGQVQEFARLDEQGLMIVSRSDGEVLARLPTGPVVEAMLVVDLDGDAQEELVVLTPDQVLIVGEAGQTVRAWPSDTRRYARTVVSEATDVVGSQLGRESVPALLAPIAQCFEDEVGLRYDRPDVVLGVSLTIDATGRVQEIALNEDHGYLYDEHRACLRRVLSKPTLPTSAGSGANQLRFRVRINWRDELATTVAARRATRRTADALLAATMSASHTGPPATTSICRELTTDSWIMQNDPARLQSLIEALEHPAFEKSAFDGGALRPPLDASTVQLRCAPDFDADGHPELLALFEWESRLDTGGACIAHEDDEDDTEPPCYPHRLHVLFAPEAGHKVLAVIADHYIGYTHDRHTLVAPIYRRLPDGRPAMRVTFTNQDASSGCFFGGSTLMVLDNHTLVRALGYPGQITPCFPDLDATPPDDPTAARCPGIHQLENIESYKRAGFEELHDHERGANFRCFRLP